MEKHPDRQDAAAALDLVAASRSTLADRLVTPPWYHPALATLTGLFTASYAARSTLVTAVACVLYGVAVGALIRTYRGTTGVWVNGYRPGPARRWAIALGVVVLLGIGAGVALDHLLDWPAAPLVAGALVFVATLWLGGRYDRALQDDLRAP